MLNIYVIYITGSLQGKPRSFLTMHEIGSSKPTYRGHMRKLGAILLALTRQLDYQANNANGYMVGQALVRTSFLFQPLNSPESWSGTDYYLCALAVYQSIFSCV